MYRSKLLIAVLLTSAIQIVSAAPITIEGGAARFSIDPATLETRWLSENQSAVVSASVHPEGGVTALEVRKNSAQWKLDGDAFAIACRVTDGGAFELVVTGAPDKKFNWPKRTFEEGEELIFARDSGLLVPVHDKFWRDELLKEEWNTLERMSMPLWGVLRDGRCISWMLSTPFRNTITFADDASGPLSISLTHDFSAKSPQRTVTWRVVVNDGASPITPALRYREWLDETGHVTTLAEKSRVVPQINQLLGAPHIYLWGDAPITAYDILPKQWKPFCSKLIANANTPDSFEMRLKSQFSELQWEQVESCVKSELTDHYMKRLIADGLSSALKSKALGDDAPSSEVERISANSELLFKHFPDTFLPVKDWGNGVSLKMLRKLKELGFDRLRLCFDGWEGIQSRPWIAKDADERGWLMGTYDSYHSIHDPAQAGTNNTWLTAQMTQDLWDTGGIMRADGSYLTGFKGTGRKLNPLAARSYFEERVSSVLQSVPFNYYFIDCDAYGEVYDDYNPRHTNAMEDDAAERTRRLGWLMKEKKVVVGAEGGNVYAIEGVALLEGLLGPYFGWGDEDMTRKDSKFYRGRYYPPDEPEVNFKPVPIKEQYRKLYYDPAVRIPLFQAAFHDAVVTTHHWSNDRFKYPEVVKTVELIEMLWMCPPMVHMNYNTVDKRGSDLKQHYDKWSPLHQKLGFTRMTSFQYLTPGHLVQMTKWGDDGDKIIANFGAAEFAGADYLVPPTSAIFVAGKKGK